MSVIFWMVWMIMGSSWSRGISIPTPFNWWFCWYLVRKSMGHSNYRAIIHTALNVHVRVKKWKLRCARVSVCACVYQCMSVFVCIEILARVSMFLYSCDWVRVNVWVSTCERKKQREMITIPFVFCLCLWAQCMFSLLHISQRQPL